MKRARIFFTVMLAMLCFLEGCLRPEEKPNPTPGTGTHHVYHLTAEYPYAVDPSDAMASIQTGLSADYLRLVNKTHTLTRWDAPDSLTRLPRSVTNYEKTVELEGRTATALEAMLREMHASGIYPKVTSGYRTYAYQSRLFNTYLEKESSEITEDAKRCLGEEYIYQNYTKYGKTGLSDADARRVVLSYSAYPGTSEHQTGLCLDFVASDGAPLDLSFEASAAFRWLSQNAYKYGFILRFPADKTAITGYSYEPWHYRFVGREAATDIHFGGLTLEEYLGEVD